MSIARAAWILLLTLSLRAQVPGTNVNMVSGTSWPNGDPYLQRQNEPSIGVSTRNPLHLLAGSNDYRTVDVPFPAGVVDENGDAWLGVFKSFDGGRSWRSNLIPGYPQDQTSVGLSSPLKAFNVATDPTVRAGTHGLLYYSGLAFDRGSSPPASASAVFVTIFQDLNNKGNGDPIQYIGTHLVVSGTSGQFNDKPGMAVDIPRSAPIGSATCNISGSNIVTGKVYVAFTDFTGNQTNNPHSRLFLASSADCGNTWSQPTLLSESNQLSQSPTVAIDPGTGAVYVAWRLLASGSQPDALMYVMATDGSHFTKAAPIFTFSPGQPFDQPSSASGFRTMTLPAIIVDASGRVWVAWSHRGLGAGGDARVVISTLARGSQAWTAPFVADPIPGSATNPAGRGHQFFPALSYAYGRIMLIFYDQRDDGTKGVLTCNAGNCVESRQPGPDLLADPTGSKVFTANIQDAGLKQRHTIDIRGSMIDPTRFTGAAQSFPSSRISQYKYGTRVQNGSIEQLQYNPPNFPMFVHGTRPFIGDFIDVAGLAFVFDDPSGKWVYNTQTTNSPVFHGTWTDNRDVRPPPLVRDPKTGALVQDWSQYTPPGPGGASTYDGTPRPVCVPTMTGSKNQNVYTARITQGLVVGIKENSKPLTASFQRQFSVFVENNLAQPASYQLTINTPPAGTLASFAFDSSILTLTVNVPAHSSISRSVFVICASAGGCNARAKITVSVLQINTANPPLQGTAVINPDSTNPAITNPDIIGPDITSPDITSPDINNPAITGAEVYNPTVTSPDITSPDITSPDITSPDIVNPDITSPDIISPDIISPDIISPDITSPDIINPDITSPDIISPDITSPDIVSPDITNPDITNLADGYTDLTWRMTNTGNTTSSYNAKLYLKRTALCQPAGSFQCQLILRKVYATPFPNPFSNGCQVSVQPQNIPVATVSNPVFATGSTPGGVDNSPDQTNATLTLGPGEGGRITIRVLGLKSNCSGGACTLPPAVPQSDVKPLSVSSGANTNNTANTPAASLTITTTGIPAATYGFAYTNILTPIGGGGGNRTWTIVAGRGSLPGGLSLSTSGQISGVVTGSPTAGGYNFSAQVTDGSQVDISALNLTVLQAPSSIGLVSSLNPSVYGQKVTFAATVTPGKIAGVQGIGQPTGLVTFAFAAGAKTYNLCGDGTLQLQPAASPCVVTLSAAGKAQVTTSLLPAGVDTINAAYGGDVNFLATASGLSSGPASVAQTVNPAPLTITASSPTITYLDSAPAITAAFSGFVNGESSTVLTALPVCTTTYTQGQNAGLYPTSCSGAAAANYRFLYVAGTLTVNKASQTITVTVPAPPTAKNNSTFPVAATAPAAGGVSITASGGCSGSGTSTAAITMTSNKINCVVTYSQPGDTNYLPAPVVSSTTVRGN